MQEANGSNRGKPVARRQKMWLEEGRDRLYPRVTVDALPDNVLLEIFELDLGKVDVDDFEVYLDHDHNRWQKLVHVCRRWRYIVFASPRRLNLAIELRESANSWALDIWPALPILIYVFGIRSKEQVTKVIAALRQRNRVRKIDYDDDDDDDDCDIQDSLWQEIAAIDEPFPLLTSLDLISYAQNAPVFPDSFLGGSAPRLRSLDLYGITYPAIGKLLSSTTNLVTLSLWRIPHSGFIAPEAIVTCLSMLAKLESLNLGFRHPRSRAHQTSRHPPPLTRVVFHNLTFFGFKGDAEYLEDILSQIETPVLERGDFSLFNRLVFVTPSLGHFIRRTEIFMTIHAARAEFNNSGVNAVLLGHGESPEPLELRIPCYPLDWQISAVAQVLNSLSSSLPTLETLEISVDRGDWQGDIEVTQWLELLHPFTSVKEMTLVRDDSVRRVAPALQELARERPMEVLPTLQELSLSTEPSGPVKEAIEQFIATRRLCGRPVSVHYLGHQK